MNLMQRLENSSSYRPNGGNRKRKQPLRPKQPAPKRQRLASGASFPRPQRAVAAAYSSGQHTGEAKVYRSGNDTCRIKHRELVATISGSTDFTIQKSFALNPGLSTSFPWLSTQAQAWERYRFNKLRYCYYTRTGTSVPGSLLMAPDFDAADPAPISEAIASSYEYCEEDAPWKDICCNLPTKALMGDMKEKYIRSGALQPNQDVKTYDAGNLFVCTIDGTGVGWGKLWVEYEVTLYNPQVPSGGFLATGTLRSTTNTSENSPFSTSASNGIFSLSASGQTVTVTNLQPGQEIILVCSCSAGADLTAFDVTPTAGLQLVTSLGKAITTSVGVFSATYLVTAETATFTFDPDTTSNTVSQCTVVISALTPKPVF